MSHLTAVSARLRCALPLPGARLVVGWGLIVAATLAALAAPSRAAPEPSLVNSSWKLDFDHDTPDAIAIKTLSGDTRWYWYMTYEVTNHTGEKRLFVPDVVIADDNGRITPAGKGVPTRVVRIIRDKIRSVYLLSQTQIVGEILEGEDHARRGVVVWPATPERDVDEYRIFFAGLSGETAAVADPITGEDVLLRRTLMLRYDLPGDDENPGDQPFLLTERREVMR